MNGVCTNIILLRQNKLHYYKGNYDTYVRTRAEQEENQMKLYKKEQDEIADIKQFVARFGHGTAKMVRQAQSREKVLKKMEEVGLTQPVENDRTSKVRCFFLLVFFFKKKKRLFFTILLLSLLLSSA